LIKLEHPWTRTFMKVFNTFDNKVVKQCQFFTGVLPLTHFYTICTMSFNEGLTVSNNMLCRVIADHSSGVDIEKMATKYNCNQLKFIGNYRKIVYDLFKIESCD